MTGEGTEIPRRLGLSGKNSARTGRTQLRFLIIGFTSEAIRFRICNALSALCLSLRCANDCMKISDIRVLKIWANMEGEKRIDRGGCIDNPRACVSQALGKA